MGRTAEVLAVERTTDRGAQVVNVQCDPGGGAIVTAQLMGAPGQDSLPLPGDTVALEDSTGCGVEQAVGFADIVNEGTSVEGEDRRYARDDSGVPVCEVCLKRDGSILIRVLKTGGAPVTIQTDGVVHVDSPDVRLGSAPGRPLACVGDFVVGSIRALSAAPGSPIVPIGGVPTPSGGVAFAAQIVSGLQSVKGGP